MLTEVFLQGFFGLFPRGISRAPSNCEFATQVLTNCKVMMSFHPLFRINQYPICIKGKKQTTQSTGGGPASLIPVISGLRRVV